jgi:hypothetical protein
MSDRATIAAGLMHSFVDDWNTPWYDQHDCRFSPNSVLCQIIIDPDSDD